ncbi:MAG: 50S ribosomal protein L35 [Nitrospirota bacterium]|uniref:Large ribosomal subunit protein bL35 n=1 Tax=Candidatus Magnetominusculus xianensis TaxID=1748249 RepID=A0ABR5SM63_9BACT|nr:50S ribosomal protein L35 [Candidatus Magnetominusculus xianensis]KWT91766.1 50S ribosomal protein L35 [Candidatus Magnetominusculus xianensis]MBF0404858.1 50S ribosomal protein L35 [Nitrospirota bacterium]
MPKLKTHRGAEKRFKKTGTGKIKRNRAYKSHMMTGKPSNRTRRLRTSTTVDATQQRNISRLIPFV